MTDEERTPEFADEAIEDLDNAADATPDDVVGGSLWQNIKQKASPEVHGTGEITIVPPDAPPDPYAGPLPPIQFLSQKPLHSKPIVGLRGHSVFVR